MDHNLILLIALVALLIGNLPKYKLASLVAIGALVYDFAIHFNITELTGILHFSIDLIIISVLSAVLQHINKDVFKILFIPIAIGLYFTIHPVNKIPISNTNTANDKNINNRNINHDLELLVQFKNSADIPNWVNANSNKYDITYPLFTPKDKSGLLDEYIGINIKNDQNANAVINELERENVIAYAEQNELLELKLPQFSSPIINSSSDTSNDPESKKQWAVDKMKMDKLHKLIESKSNVNNNKTTLIAILDTGVEAIHEDLANNYISLNTSYDRDVRGHGTHCAGIAAAVTGNNIGIASLLPANSEIKVTSIKVLSNFGIGAQHQIITGMIEAADKGADVISMSLGAPSNLEREKTYKEAVQYANNQGAIVVVAAGNSNADAAKYSPANTPGVIAVAAINKDLKKASFSNTIDNVQMGIAAPGQDIYSTISGNKYAFQSGTSMAAPFISGLVGLMKSIDPNITTDEAFQILNSTSSQHDKLNVVNPYLVIEKMIGRN